MTSSPVITLYGKPGCCLCGEARDWLRGLRDEGRALELVEVDVSTDPALEREYGSRIPVVVLAGSTVSELELDREGVLSRLDRVKA